MKKSKLNLIPGTVGFTRPFTGDCIRQTQLNRSVDDLVRDQNSTASSRQTKPAHKILRTAGKALSTVLMFAAAIGCAYGVMAL